MATETDFFRQVMGCFTTGVTIATTNNQGKPSGLTVSSFTSLSLDPLLVLICVDRASHTLPHFRESKIFAVNFLTAKQIHLSYCFSTPSEDRFEHFCHTPYHIASTGAPILDHILAFVDTRIVAEYPGGDHVIFVGQVEAMGTAGKVFFAREEGKVRSTLTDYYEYTATSSNGSRPIDDTAPLAYYRGQYHHLANYSIKSNLEKTDYLKAKPTED